MKTAPKNPKPNKALTEKRRASANYSMTCSNAVMNTLKLKRFPCLGFMFYFVPTFDQMNNIEFVDEYYRKHNADAPLKITMSPREVYAAIKGRE